jgi:hypothetical protein
LSWDEPESPNGIITNYRVETFLISFLYETPEGCEVPDLDSRNNTPNHNHSHTIQYGHAEYGMKVAAINKFPGNWSDPKYIQTLPSKPNPAFDFKVLEQSFPNSDEPYNTTATLAWKIPCILNGILDKFYLSFSGKKEGQPDHIFTRSFRPNSDEISQNYELIESKFQPDFTYKINLFITVKDCEEMSEPVVLEYKSLPGSES